MSQLFLSIFQAKTFSHVLNDIAFIEGHVSVKFLGVKVAQQTLESGEFLAEGYGSTIGGDPGLLDIDFY